MGVLRLQLSDGLNQGQEIQFRIRVKELNIRLKNHEQLDVFPMTQSPLRTQHLLVVTSDNDHFPNRTETNSFINIQRREIVFLVKSPPKLGVLLFMRSGSERAREVQNFTQSDVNEGRVLYKHVKPFSNLTVFDSIGLEANAEYAKRRLDLVLNVRVSVTAGSTWSENEDRPGIERYIESEDARVTEGGSVIFRKKNFDTSGILTFIKEHRQAASGGSDQYHQYLRAPQLELEITELPSHGEFTISKERAKIGQRFSQSDIDMGFLAYKHDDSDTLVDYYGFAVYLIGDKSERYGDGRGHSGDILLSDAIWNISITPINDRNFHLVSNDGMTVVQRQAKAITRNMLYTQDDDTPPEDIVYVIQNSPIHGHLVFNDNITRPATRFTQQDIDQRRIVYFHDGDGSLKPDQFRFRVSDLKFPPIYRHFRIHVTPLTLTLTNSSSIFIQQGTRMAYVTSYNMGSQTNGQRSNTYYNITSGANGGRLELNGAPSSMFSQINVDNEEVVYIQTVMTLANDSFVATIVNQDAVKKNQLFKIVVLPLVKRNGTLICNLSEGKNVPFQQHHLDASQLAGLTNSNPIYFVLEPPKYGKLMRIIKPSSSGSRGGDVNGKISVGLKSLRHKEVRQFTHEDIKNGVVYFVPAEEKLNTFIKKRDSYNGQGENMAQSINDSFRYRLEAPGVQPANGALEFIIGLPVSRYVKFILCLD